MLLNPDRIHVEDLIERRRLEDCNDHYGDERVNDALLDGRESSPFELPSLHSRRQVAVSVQISGKAKEHENRGDAEAVVPAINLCEHTAEQRSGDCSDIDCGTEDDETASAARFVLWRIKRADLRRNVALQKTRADDKQEQGEEERLIKCHRDMTCTHREIADNECSPLPYQAFS